jgi:hypothetical protein
MSGLSAEAILFLASLISGVMILGPPFKSDLAFAGLQLYRSTDESSNHEDKKRGREPFP